MGDLNLDFDMGTKNISIGNSFITRGKQYLKIFIIVSLFPNFIIGTYYPGQICVYLNNPIKAGKTYQKRIIYTTKGHNLNKTEIKNQKNLWWKVHKEDHEK